MPRARWQALAAASGSVLPALYPNPGPVRAGPPISAPLQDNTDGVGAAMARDRRPSATPLEGLCLGTMMLAQNMEKDEEEDSETEADSEGVHSQKTGGTDGAESDTEADTEQMDRCAPPLRCLTRLAPSRTSPTSLKPTRSAHPLQDGRGKLVPRPALQPHGWQADPRSAEHHLLCRCRVHVQGSG